jgi:hypothetical protein
MRPERVGRYPQTPKGAQGNHTAFEPFQLPFLETSMLKIWNNMFMLGIEAQQVIWLRAMRIVAGGKIGKREARRMVSEKATAAGEAGLSLAAGKSVDSVIKAYRRKVRSNRRRLSR